jgi:integrase
VRNWESPSRPVRGFLDPPASVGWFCTKRGGAAATARPRTHGGTREPSATYTAPTLRHRHPLPKAGSWYGRWRVAGRKVTRKLGPARQPGTREGLTRSQAERELRRRMERQDAVTATTARLTVEEAAGRLIDHLEALGRKRSTIEGYRSVLTVHLVPFFRDRPLDRISREEVEAFMAHRTREGGAPKSTMNYVGVLHSIFDFAVKRGWARSNPCKQVEKPRPNTDRQIHFLDDAELEAVLAAVSDDPLGATERVLYLTAAMTGARQGELIALRWEDIDWVARKIRIRRNYVRGEYGTPKSLRSSRAIPMGDRLAAELEHHYQRSTLQDDTDLVFPHPLTGTPLDRSKVLKRLKAACRRAGVREIRFHDLRHTFGTRMAKVTQLRDVQEWMGHRDAKTTSIYADWMPGEREADLVDLAFGNQRDREREKGTGIEPARPDRPALITTPSQEAVPGVAFTTPNARGTP